MKTCRENCIHRDVCGCRSYEEEICDNFKDKALFIELPCPIGTTYYRIIEREGKHKGRFLVIREAELNYYNIDKVMADKGKTVFFTREEAEETLAERSRQ